MSAYTNERYDQIVCHWCPTVIPVHFEDFDIGVKRPLVFSAIRGTSRSASEWPESERRELGGPGGPSGGEPRGPCVTMSSCRYPPFFFSPFFTAWKRKHFTFCFHFFHLSRFIQHFVELSFRYSFRWAVEAWTRCWMRTPRRGRYRYHCCRWRRRRRDVWQKRQDV